jgi:hypothetical protein
MLQVLHDQTWELDADGGGPLMHVGREASPAAPTCMCRRMRNVAVGGARPTGAARAATRDDDSSSSVWTGAAIACR